MLFINIHAIHKSSPVASWDSKESFDCALQNPVRSRRSSWYFLPIVFHIPCIRTYYSLVLGDMVIFHIVISPACEIADTRYYCAWVGGGKRETLCTCHKLFHNYLVILNRACVREREPGSSLPITEIIYFQTYWKTNMLNIKIFKTASSYSDTAVIHRYYDRASYCDKFAASARKLSV